MRLVAKQVCEFFLNTRPSCAKKQIGARASGQVSLPAQSQYYHTVTHVPSWGSNIT